METLFNLVLWGVPGAAVFALIGVPFGALARVVAQVQGRVHEATPWLALRSGAVSGGLFFAVLGFLTGAVLGWSGPTLEDGLYWLAAVFLSLLALVLVAVLFSLAAYFGGWLGVRASGILVAVFIALVFAGIHAEKEAYDRTLSTAVLAGIGLLVLALVTVFRCRSPLRDQVFAPWPDSALAERHHLDSHARFRSTD